MNTYRPLYLILAIALTAAFLFGCSSDDSTPPLGNLRVIHNLDSPGTGNGMVAIGPEVTDVTFTGITSSGATKYGPATFPIASEHFLSDVHHDVVLMMVDYTNADGSLHAAAEVPVQIKTGETTTHAALATKGLTVQLVNESGLSDDDMYVLLSANGDIQVDTEGGTLAVYEIGTGSADVSAQPMSKLHKVGTRVSPFTGDTHNVYEFKPTKVVSGRLWISYGEALTYEKGDSAPDNFKPNVRYDKMEMGYAPGNPTGYFDLTSVDFFAIPMQLEVLADPDDETPFQVTTFYTSTLTLLNALFDLDTATMADAFFEKGTAKGSSPVKGWNPSVNSIDTFVRAMSPSTLVSQQPSKPGDPYTAAPYSSFANYMTELANAGAYVDFAGKNGVDAGALTKWAYRAAITSDQAGGFVATCRPTAAMDNTPQGSLGDTYYPNDPNLPKDLTVEVSLSKEFFDQYIYGVPANSFMVKDLDCHLIPYSKNSVYANIAGNFLAGLNFGYVNGRYGSDATHWFDVLPGYPPYGAARPAPDDGYYNAYAAVLYNLSDAYSYSISDRLQIGNPLVTTSPDKPYLRITILPDDRLDAPQNVKLATGKDDTSFQVSWDPIAAPSTGFTFTGYRVIATDGSVPVVDPKQPPPAKLKLNQIVTPPLDQPPTTNTSACLSGLTPNTVYQVFVVAEGVFKGQPISSTRGNFAQAATPSQTASPPTSFMSFAVGVSEPADAPTGTTYTVDGNSVNNTTIQPLKRSRPQSQGNLVQALFEIGGPDPANPKAVITYAQTNIFFNAFDAGNNRFNPYFNFPFSSSVPDATQLTTLMDGSSLKFAYSANFGDPPVTQPPFGDDANSLVLTVAPNPIGMPKIPSKVTVPSQTPVTPNPSPPPAPLPNYKPTPYTPASACPTFTVQAVLSKDSPVKDLSDLKGATVQFVRLVTYPGTPGGEPQKPSADGSGADAKKVINDDTGGVQFDPKQVPYNAPVWNLGYRVDIVYYDVKTKTTTTYSAYGAWKTPAVGIEWKSGLTGQTDTPGVIYVPFYPAPPEQVVWGN